MLRAPIWSRSALSTTAGKVSVSFTSVTIFRPVSDRAFDSRSSPTCFRPWKSYGLVRGLNAPPRKREAPLAATPRAAVRICCSFSTAQGPAITTSSGPPIGTPPTSTTVSSCFTSRETSLYGAVTGMQSATPGSSRKWPGSMGPLFPVIPIAVRPAPEIGWGVKPSSRTRPSMVACACGVTSGCRTMSIARALLYAGPLKIPQERLSWWDCRAQARIRSCAQARPSFQPRSLEPLGRGHSLLSLRLDLVELPGGAGSGSEGGAVEQLSGGTGAAHRPCSVDLQHGPADRRPGSRPGRESAAARVQLRRRPGPVHAAVLAGQEGRVRRFRVVLRHPRQLAALQHPKRPGQRIRSQGTELFQQGLAGLVGRDRKPGLQPDVPGIEALVHLHDGDAGLALLARDGPLRRSGAPQVRQQGRVYVQAAMHRHRQGVGREDPPVGRHHRDIGTGGCEHRGEPSLLHLLRLLDADAALHG